MNSTKFVYPHRIWNKVNDLFMTLLSIVFFVIGLVCLWEFILSLTNLDQSTSSSTLFLLLGFVGFSLWSPFVFMSVSYCSTDIEVQDDGLMIVFMFKILYVKWTDIIVFKPARFLGISKMSKTNVVVVKNALTLFHRIYGLAYGQTNQSAFLIMPNISHHDELMAVIKKNIKNKNK